MISFVGAGPGAVDLITMRGARRLHDADIVIWASSLVPAALLEHCGAEAQIHDSATMTLEDVIGIYAANPQRSIVRLHSGDPSIYGAIAEQIEWCAANQRRYEIVPGVTSVSAAAAVLGRELTVPTLAQSVIATRLAGRTAASMPPGEGVAAMAVHGTTMAIFLAGARPDELVDELLGEGSGYGASTPAAVLVRATWPDEQVVMTTVGALAQAIASTGATMTVLVVVGEVLGAGSVPARSHLYHPTYTTAYRLRSESGSTVGRPSRNR